MSEPFGRPQVDPRQLTKAELEALIAIDGWKLRRVYGGYRSGGSPLVTLKMAHRLLGKGLIRFDATTRPICLTGIGRNTLDVYEQRRQSA